MRHLTEVYRLVTSFSIVPVSQPAFFSAGDGGATVSIATRLTWRGIQVYLAIRPLRMQEVQTISVLWAPFTRALTLRRLGFQRREVTLWA
jgi:hypothetical protein